MDIETIEKAARDYIKPTAGIIPVAESIAAKLGFMVGAEWRVNSVWHSTCDIAEPGKDCLVEHMDGDGNVCIRIDWRSEYEWVNACHYDKVLRWAYVADLLPSGKEVRT